MAGKWSRFGMAGDVGMEAPRRHAPRPERRESHPPSARAQSGAK